MLASVPVHIPNTPDAIHDASTTPWPRAASPRAKRLSEPEVVMVVPARRLNVARAASRWLFATRIVPYNHTVNSSRAGGVVPRCHVLPQGSVKALHDI